MSNTSFAPAGVTDDPQIKTASSLVDYIFRRLAFEYLNIDDRLELGLATLEDLEAELAAQQPSLLEPSNQSLLQTQDMPQTEQSEDASIKDAIVPDAEDEKPAPTVKAAESEKQDSAKMVSMSASSAPLCSNCGNMTQRAGSCYICPACGTTSGCS
jgi:ribonucleoside-diphosphate reductase alpha chain